MGHLSVLFPLKHQEEFCVMLVYVRAALDLCWVIRGLGHLDLS